MKIVRLRKKVAEENIGRLIQIDGVVPESSWTASNFLMDLPSKWEHSFIALEHDQIVGFVICSSDGSNLHIHRIAVSTECQRKGIGTKLVKHVLARCTHPGINTVTLKVEQSNLSAQKFYKRIRFGKVASEGLRYIYKKVVA